MAEIINIKNEAGEVQYPVTKPECVIDENGKSVLTLIQENGTELRQEIDELSEKIDNLPQGDEFDKKGNYPLLHVGTADDLAGRGESVPAEFGFRASGGKSIKDGRAYIKRIKGNSVVWNQQLKGNFTASNAEVTETANGYNIVPAGPAPGITTSNLVPIVGHKYVLLCTKNGGSKNIYLNWGGYNTSLPTPFLTATDATKTFFTLYSYQETETFTLTKPHLIDLTQMFGAGNEPTTIEEFNARVATLGVDLNAYNEGQVIHCNTESIKSVGDNAWDEEWENGTFNTTTGENINDAARLNQVRSKSLIEILPSTQYTIRQPSLGTDGAWVMLFDKEKNIIKGYNGGTAALNGNSFKIPSASPTLITAPNAAYMRFYMPAGYGDTYNHDIMITLVHSGWKQDTDAGYQPYWQDTLPLPIIRKYFPDGMKKAGTAHDEIRYNKASGKWEYSKGKIKSVDMGTLSWDLYSGNFYSTFGAESDIKMDSILLCSAYNGITPQGLEYNDEDKAIWYQINSSDKTIIVRDTSYTDAASFKAMLQEKQVKLYYESDNWEWVELDEADQNFRDYYNVADFGTEMSQSSVPSANFSADIIYQFNAVDMIREHEIEITELQKVIATMQAQLTSLINGGQ